MIRTRRRTMATNGSDQMISIVSGSVTSNQSASVIRNSDGSVISNRSVTHIVEKITPLEMGGARREVRATRTKMTKSVKYRTDENLSAFRRQMESNFVRTVEEEIEVDEQFTSTTIVNRADTEVPVETVLHGNESETAQNIQTVHVYNHPVNRAPNGLILVSPTVNIYDSQGHGAPAEHIPDPSRRVYNHPVNRAPNVHILVSPTVNIYDSQGHGTPAEHIPDPSRRVYNHPVNRAPNGHILVSPTVNIYDSQGHGTPAEHIPDPSRRVYNHPVNRAPNGHILVSPTVNIYDSQGHGTPAEHIPDPSRRVYNHPVNRAPNGHILVSPTVNVYDSQGHGTPAEHIPDPSRRVYNHPVNRAPNGHILVSPTVNIYDSQGHGTPAEHIPDPSGRRSPVVYYFDPPGSDSPARRSRVVHYFDPPGSESPARRSPVVHYFDPPGSESPARRSPVVHYFDPPGSESPGRCSQVVHYVDPPGSESPARRSTVIHDFDPPGLESPARRSAVVHHFGLPGSESPARRSPVVHYFAPPGSESPAAHICDPSARFIPRIQFFDPPNLNTSVENLSDCPKLGTDTVHIYDPTTSRTTRAHFVDPPIHNQDEPVIGEPNDCRGNHFHAGQDVMFNALNTHRDTTGRQFFFQRSPKPASEVPTVTKFVNRGGMSSFVRCGRSRMIADQTTAIPVGEFRSQLENTSDIVGGLDVAPSTKSFMNYLNERGNFFAYPGHKMDSENLGKLYRRHLRTRLIPEEETFNDMKLLPVGYKPEVDLTKIKRITRKRRYPEAEEYHRRMQQQQVEPNGQDYEGDLKPQLRTVCDQSPVDLTKKKKISRKRRYPEAEEYHRSMQQQQIEPNGQDYEGDLKPQLRTVCEQSPVDLTKKKRISRKKRYAETEEYHRRMQQEQVEPNGQDYEGDLKPQLRTVCEQSPVDLTKKKRISRKKRYAETEEYHRRMQQEQVEPNGQDYEGDLKPQLRTVCEQSPVDLTKIKRISRRKRYAQAEEYHQRMQQEQVEPNGQDYEGDLKRQLRTVCEQSPVALTRKKRSTRERRYPEAEEYHRRMQQQQVEPNGQDYEGDLKPQLRTDCEQSPVALTKKKRSTRKRRYAETEEYHRRMQQQQIEPKCQDYEGDRMPQFRTVCVQSPGTMNREKVVDEGPAPYQGRAYSQQNFQVLLAAAAESGCSSKKGRKKGKKKGKKKARKEEVVEGRKEGRSSRRKKGKKK